MSCPVADYLRTVVAWVASASNFFLPVRVLSRVFSRGKFLAGLRAAFAKGDVGLRGGPVRAGVSAAVRTDWVVYAKPPFGGPEQVLKYLARYTHRVAISNARILDFEDGMVRFRYKDYAHGNRRRVMTLTGRWSSSFGAAVAACAADGFMRLRHYGILANRHRHREAGIVPPVVRLRPRGRAGIARDKAGQHENLSSITPTCERAFLLRSAVRMIMIEEFPPLPAGQQAHERSGQRRGFDSS